MAEPVALVARGCPVCQSRDESAVFAQASVDLSRWADYSFASRKLPEYAHFRLLDCPTCRLLYASPIPTLETLSRSYRQAEFDTTVEGSYASRTYGLEAKRLVPQLPDLQGALDIGTGTGSFLEELLKLKFTGIVGVEPSRAPVLAARPDVRPLIREGLFDEKDFTPASLGLVSCFQTLEHLHDPLGMCQAAFRLLKPNGAVLFVFHNRQALSARILGFRSPIFDVEHLQLFSPASARFMLSKCGFRDIECRTLINTYPLAYWIRLLPFPAPLKDGLLKALKMTRLGSLPLPLPAGNLVAIAFKRG